MILLKRLNLVLAEFHLILTSEKQKRKGLMFAKKLKNMALIFKYDKPQKLPIHMLFVFQYIDIIWLKDNHVIDFKQYVTPFTPFLSHKGYADTFIELPAGSISGIKLGDKVEI